MSLIVIDVSQFFHSEVILSETKCYLYKYNIFVGMTFLRYFLFPLAIVYSSVTSLRNLFFDLGIFSSKTYSNPTIGVGNLSVGGTGKSVCVDYIVSLLKEDKPLAVLSRGYGRLSKGFLEADQNSTFKSIGDEPMMLYSKHPDVRVAVSERRRRGMENLLKTSDSETVFVWDDCMQHRWVSPDLMILLTSHDHLFVDDFHLPVGNLRELSSGKKRADVIIVTKCPTQIDQKSKDRIESKLQLAKTQHLFFAHIGYSDLIRNKERTFPIDKIENIPFLLVTGIADPKPLLYYLRAIGGQFEHMEFKDHHLFTEKDIEHIKKRSNGSLILTTEKDFARLNTIIDSNLLFYISIEMKLDEKDQDHLNRILIENSTKTKV
ncbi:MAG: tetraacyldisaccharide 4'-kinase [Flavobacteriaceae bacterium]|jgi:tetraacyldisaccharide 4'-kinase|nr:tetraacyldisaccharide 4'-kinase [Flavobacteriaceae bacterium]